MTDHDVTCAKCGHRESDHRDIHYEPSGCGLCECAEVPKDILRAALSERDAQLEAAWDATGVADAVRGTTTLADVVGTQRADLQRIKTYATQQLAEARRERDEARRTLRTELAGYDRMACELGICKKQHDALAAQLRDADALMYYLDGDPLLAGRIQERITAWREKTKDAHWRLK